MLYTFMLRGDAGDNGAKQILPNTEASWCVLVYVRARQFSGGEGEPREQKIRQTRATRLRGTPAVGTELLYCSAAICWSARAAPLPASQPPNTEISQSFKRRQGD